MFLRRKKMSWLNLVRESVWPRAGWSRVLTYLFHRTARLSASPYAVAAGFACGAAISFTPFVGLHIALGCLIAWIIRSNLFAAVLGTAVGNPWTFPLIWIWIFKFGHWLLDSTGGAQASAVDFHVFFSNVVTAVLRFDLAFLFETAWPVLWPMIVGGIPTALVMWCVFYFPLRPMVAGYQTRRRVRRLKKDEAKYDETTPTGR